MSVILRALQKPEESQTSASKESVPSFLDEAVWDPSSLRSSG